ncbi:hypothetical protein HPG02_00495 [Pediococcus pentosaceus]|uniref:hypothetical protein n=1 Tax=Pediococcus pentosaceus TaxID=1255 RepID=UPI001C1EE947|nr:hypothetical protein [Pediococcus pentosaceus]MBU7002116.1 hypothetical protein [Pediococcus pentosaceus]MCG9227392.1 hypothetical protein [Pediococcus pentosaceus]MDA8037471.1 hypothetical protein [Pediococcus pentosaceus]
MANKAAVTQFKFNTLEIDGKSYVFLGIEKNNLIDLINAESKANKSVFEKILKKTKTEKQDVLQVSNNLGEVYLTVLKILKNKGTVNLKLKNNHDLTDEFDLLNIHSNSDC